ncbi:MAG: lipoate--protein ligase family protein [Candidatus Acetothermia bacterium]|jgi:lipoate-protein ligase A|nr:lipoate--protein ligase family protein [Candidatus Acetothermia bacterium]
MRVLLDLAFRDPTVNLGLEEAILAQVAEGRMPPTLRIWRNGRCVVVGRGQRAEDEADLALCERYRVPVLKRPSGGGAVYHHPGNLNFSLYLPLSGPWASVRGSQNRLSGLLAGAIRDRFGLPAEAREGAVFVGEPKVSGSAQLRRRALLHHGTLLLWPDALSMDSLLLALRPGYAPTGVPSHPAPVGHLSTLTGREVTVEDGIRTILEAFRPLGVPAVEAISLREWALAHGLAAAYRGEA